MFPLMQKLLNILETDLFLCDLLYVHGPVLSPLHAVDDLVLIRGTHCADFHAVGEEEGELVAGAIYDPTRDELFWAEKGLGAFLNDSRIRISERRDLVNCLIATEVHSEAINADGHNDYIAEIGNASGAIRDLGSTSLDLAYIAAGRLDGFWHPQILPWEMAAGIIIVKEAGGYITDLTGGIKMSHKTEILAANARIHHRLLRLTKAITDEKKSRL